MKDNDELSLRWTTERKNYLKLTSVELGFEVRAKKLFAETYWMRQLMLKEIH